MDAALLNIMRSGGRNRAWAESMVNMEARKLIDTANRISCFHFHGGLAKIEFVQEIKSVIEQQFALARRAKSDEECIACIKKLRIEKEELEEQDRLLRMRVAKLYAKVEFVRKNNKIVGYVISAVNIVVSGLVILGGALMISTMTPIGTLAGAILVIDGVNGISKEWLHLSRGADYETEGFIADRVIESAEFMGFTHKTGLAFYKTATLGSEIYSIAGLTRKYGAKRLFYWMYNDYYRKVNAMSRPALTMKITGYGVKAKVIFDILSPERSSN